MTSTPCRSAAVDCIIAPWAAKVAAFLGAIVETILTIAGYIGTTLQELGACRRKARRRLPALRPGLSRPMMSKPGFLPPVAGRSTPLPASARPNSGGQAVMMDLRGKSEAWIKAGFAGPSVPERSRRLMTILVAPELDDDIGSGRQTCPHVKSARRSGRILNPLSAGNTSPVRIETYFAAHGGGAAALACRASVCAVS